MIVVGSCGVEPLFQFGQGLRLLLGQFQLLVSLHNYNKIQIISLLSNLLLYSILHSLSPQKWKSDCAKQTLICNKRALRYNIKISQMVEYIQPGTLSIQKKLFHKYAASQIYFYPNMINQIVKERRTPTNIFYEDVEYLIDLEENLKRWYQSKEFDNKMFTFKEYYFYHQDCPRIFMKGLEQAYAKWQDKKRDLVYKRLKLIYNESYSSSGESQVDQQKSRNYVAMSHFLLEISQYNPYSKKYYLRTEARKQKQKKKLEDEKKNHSKRDLQNLQHELSAMLNDLSTISQISTLSNNSPMAADKDRLKGKIRNYVQQKSEEISKSNSTSLSNSNSIIKFNFKKKKESIQKLVNLRQFKSNNKSNSKEKDSIVQDRLSPKMTNNHISTQLLKTKSIFTVSTFGPINKHQDIKNYATKKEPLRINFQTKKINLEQQPRKFETQKKKEATLPKTISIKTKSVSKLQKRPTLEKGPIRQSSHGKLLKYDEFSDKKLGFQGHQQFRMRSLKSEFIGNKKDLLHIRPTIEFEKGKRALQLKNR